jgi:hypothetical protein
MGRQKSRKSTGCGLNPIPAIRLLHSRLKRTRSETFVSKQGYRIEPLISPTIVMENRTLMMSVYTNIQAFRAPECKARWTMKYLTGPTPRAKIVPNCTLVHKCGVTDSSRDIVKKKVAPAPFSLVAQIRPPCRSTILLQIASPMPVPGDCLLSRSNTPNIFSAY